jgi:hypothetical protein
MNILLTRRWECPAI